MCKHNKWPKNNNFGTKRLRQNWMIGKLRQAKIIFGNKQAVGFQNEEKELEVNLTWNLQFQKFLALIKEIWRK